MTLFSSIITIAIEKALADSFRLQRAFVLVSLLLVCVVLPPQALAACREGCLTEGNTVLGDGALLNDTGSNNIAIGKEALENNVTGHGNIAVGTGAGDQITTGNQNIYIGIHVTGPEGESNTIRLGHQNVHRRAFIGGISGTPVSGAPVVVDTGGHLGVVASSARFKTDIKAMDSASEAIFGLKPVAFRYKAEIDPTGVLQFGLIAEDVAKVNPALLTRDADGKPYSVRYEAVNAMLLNEFLKAHRKMENQEKHIEALEAELKEQKMLIQKVSAQIEQKQPAHVVANNQ